MNRQKRVCRFALVSAALATLGVSSSMRADTNTVLVQTGVTAAPGSGGGTFFNLINPPAINASGQMAFNALLSGTSDGTGRAMMRVEANGNLTPIFRDLQPALGFGGGTFADLLVPSINSPGQVMSYTLLNGTTDASSYGYFRGDGTTTAVLLRDQMAAPGVGGGTIAGASNWSFNDQGTVTAWTTVVLPNNALSQGIFQGSGGAIAAVAREGQSAPGAGGGSFNNVQFAESNNSGQAVFYSALIGTNNGTNTGVFRFNSVAGEVARNGQAAAGGGTYNAFSNVPPMINDSGQVMFQALLNGSPDGATFGIFRNTINAGTVAIAREGQSAPGGGNYSGLGSGDMLLNQKGQVLYQAGLTGAPDGATRAIFRGNGTDSISIARKGMVVPGGGSIDVLAGDMAFNNAGVALFRAVLTGTPGGTNDNDALYLSDGRDLVQVVRKGQALSSSIVSGYGFNQFTFANGFNAINDAGQVAYNAFLADGSSVLMRFLPSIHWREPFGGSWDNSSNWTLGISPASLHEVLIDPQQGANVSGPVGNVTIASLLVAGKEGTAFLNLNGGGQLSVSGVTTIKSTGSVNISSGKFLGGSVANDGSLSVTVGGQYSSSSLINNNNVNFFGPSSVAGQFVNNGFMTVSHTTLGGGTLTNNVQLNLDAATVSNPIVNEVGGILTARGTVSSLITNKGTLNVSGLLTIVGLTNTGLISANAGSTVAQGTIANTGIITLAGGGITSPITNNAGGIVQGGGGITALLVNNTGGLIFANSPTYPLLISSISTNQAGARLRVADGSTLNISNSVSNSGLITLGGDDANFNVGGNLTITNSNSGIISGAGSISANVNNSGTVRAEGGQLMITGPGSSNQTSGLLQVSDGATLLYAQGLGTNSGIINVSGGSLIIDTVSTFTNSGKISGYGTFTTSTWSNQGTMTFTGGFTTINGNLSNGSTRKIEVAYNPALFTGNVTNSGIFKNTKTSITFGGTYTENGTFISDPADNFFSSVNIGDNGAWVGGVGDRFFLSGDLLSSSKNKSGWQTAEAELRLMGGVKHLLSVSGADRGISFDGYRDNFGWGTLVVDGGDSITLGDGDDVPGGGLYVHRLLLGGGVGQVSSIQGNGLNIYYDLGEPANAYLGGQTYSLAGGGSISPVPEPMTMLSALAGVAGLLQRRRRCQ